jgi:catechol 2,3-dioxygenase-like lactoylglutathione lyase family enzyme
MNLNHLHLHVASVPRAAAFYERYFGMRELVWHGDMVFMRDRGGMDLALAPGEDAGAFPEWFHFGFRLPDLEAVQTLEARLTADAVEIDTPYTVEGPLGFFRCRDPDGHLIEVYYEPDPA